MKAYSELMTKLVEALSKLPGIGKRSAERIVFYLLKTRQEEALNLGALIKQLRESVVFCSVCHNFSDKKLCHICDDPGRDQGVICVVEDPKDVVALEKTGDYPGVYHVLLGALSPLDGIGPDQICIQDLLERVKTKKIREVILATNPNTEGDTTALYLGKVLQPLKVKVTRLARGIPVGSHIEYTDQATLSRALSGRHSV
ncbi:MAG TPA: recombination mediator RecR [Candidatus Omnitrophota bacterium]|nr:recombination mediator RecR [Candidatus Omnitrophota bacterium]HPS36233.1 recombination mediator RecR [Candidatus Omnitrophota bacterium]